MYQPHVGDEDAVHVVVVQRVAAVLQLVVVNHADERMQFLRPDIPCVVINAVYLQNLFHAVKIRLVELIFVEFDVENLPLVNTDAGVATLVRLVAVMAAEILHSAIISDRNFIYGKKAETRSFKLCALNFKL